MTRKPSPKAPDKSLRTRAESRMRRREQTKAPDATTRDDANVSRLYHELEVHRVELEMQNEELRVRRNELESSLEKYADLYDFAPTGYFTLDAVGIIRECNLAGAALLGEPRSLIAGRGFRPFVSPASRDAFDDFVRAAWADGATKVVCEIACITTAREARHARLDGIVCGAGSARTLRLSASDITDRVRADEERNRLSKELAQARRMEAVGRLAGGVAHDLNNLLTPIMGYGQLLTVDIEPGSPLREAADEILGASMKARDLIRQLMAYGRVQVLEMAPTDINSVVVKFQRLLRRTIRTDIAIELSLGTSLPLVAVDAGQIEQVLMNIAVNAEDAMPAGGRLTIETTVANVGPNDEEGFEGPRPEPHVLLAISDSGVGMDAATAEQVFTPFFTTKERGRGNGLGLATVEGIVSQHGGSVSVESAPGRGTTFRVFLPVAPGEASAVPGLPAATHTTGTETMLVVDDEPLVRKWTVRCLERMGYTALAAGGALEALALLDAHAGPIHLLLTDVVMPGGNGTALFRAAAAHVPSLKVLYMSGYPEDVDDMRGLLDPGARFIQKPFSIATLAGKVRETLDAAPGRAKARASHR
jgi:two-component system, cell cycle sensor histidine kinase and response regulator CckA